MADQRDESSGYDDINEDEDAATSPLAMMAEKRFGLEPYLYDRLLCLRHPTQVKELIHKTILRQNLGRNLYS